MPFKTLFMGIQFILFIVSLPNDAFHHLPHQHLSERNTADMKHVISLVAIWIEAISLYKKNVSHHCRLTVRDWQVVLKKLKIQTKLILPGANT